MSAAAIIGVGLTPFGRFKEQSLSQLAGQAIAAALADAGISPAEVQAAFVANSMASVTTGQVAVVGLAVQTVAAGRAEVVLVVGVEKLFAASRGDSYRALNGAGFG